MLGLGLAVLSGVAAAQALSGARSLASAQRVLAAAEQDPVADQLPSAVAQARQEVGEAQDSLSSLPVRLVSAVPLLGRSLVAEQRVVTATASTLYGMSVGLDRLGQLAPVGGRVDPAVLRGLAEALTPAAESARADLDRLAEVRTALTPPQVGRGVRTAYDGLAPVVESLSRGAECASLMAGLLGAEGPRQVLVLLQNNAELRGAGGYVSTFATATFQDGRLDMQPVRDIIDLVPAPQQVQKVPADPELVEDFGVFLGDTTYMRQVNMTPDVPAAASVAAEAIGRLLGTRPDVVVLLDVPALAAGVRIAGGQVALPDGTLVNDTELADALLVDAYARAGNDSRSQIERRSDLRQAATEAVRELLFGGTNPLQALRELPRLAQGRHLAVWSDRPDEQSSLVRLGLSGAVAAGEDDMVLVAVNNLGANKVDYYMRREVDVDAVVGPQSVEVTQTVRLTNTAPDGLVAYVAGQDLQANALNRLEFSVSKHASIATVTVDGAPAEVTARYGVGRARIATRVQVPRGATAEVVLQYSVPVVDGGYRLHLIPQPLVIDAALTLRLRPADGHRLVDVTGVDPVDGVVREQAPFTGRRLVTTGLTAATSSAVASGTAGYRTYNRPG